jgi:hypothetical protein
MISPSMAVSPQMENISLPLRSQREDLEGLQGPADSEHPVEFKYRGTLLGKGASCSGIGQH